MQIENFSALESEVLSAVGEKINTFEALLSKVTFGERLLSQTIESLISRNKLKFDQTTKKYHQDTPIEGEMIILDGNLLLPTTIIRLPERGIMYVSRGSWYEFPIDFDIRRIIWNIKLIGKNNSTLVEMIRTSVLKERKSKIVHNKQWDQIKDKVVPYNNNVYLLINNVGDEVTDISIQFRIFFDKKTEGSPIFRTFSVPSEISTQELIDELHKPFAERDYKTNIKLNLIYNITDFLFLNNEIPIKFENETLQYVKINSVKKGFELIYYNMGKDGVRKKIDTEFYENPIEAMEKFKLIFSGLPARMLLENDFMFEYTK